MKLREVEMCYDCGYKGESKIKSRFNWIIFIVLCFFYFIPGIIYLFRALSTVKSVCRNCGSERVKLAPLK